MHQNLCGSYKRSHLKKGENFSSPFVLKISNGGVRRIGKNARGSGRDWFAGQEKAREAVEVTGNDGVIGDIDPSSQCCGCRLALLVVLRISRRRELPTRPSAVGRDVGGFPGPPPWVAPTSDCVAPTLRHGSRLRDSQVLPLNVEPNVRDPRSVGFFF